MSGQRLDAPISEQMTQLSKSIKSRDERRMKQKRQRQRQADYAEGDWEHSERSVRKECKKSKSGARATGGITLGPAHGQPTAPLPPPKTYKCQICNATFHSEVQHQQHLAGPVHRKAVEKLEALKRNDPHARHSAAAESALQAARWQSQGEHISRFRCAKPLPPVAPMNAYRGKQYEKPGNIHMGPTHEQLVAKLRSDNEPLNINGWVPPTVATLQSSNSRIPAAAIEEDQESRDGTPISPQASNHGSDLAQATSGTSSRDSSPEDCSEEGTNLANSNVLGLPNYSSSEDKE